MFLPQKQDTIHQAWLFRLLSVILDNQLLAQKLAFKGGTYAAMMGWLDRFSVDLDFDFLGEKKEIMNIRKELEKIFSDLNLKIKDQSKNSLQYFLKYENKNSQRNTIKIDANFPVPKNNIYQRVKLSQIDRSALGQTRETLVANKFVALIDRYEKNNSITARDIYDIHYFLINGFEYNKSVIEERQKIKTVDFLKKLKKFILTKVTEKIITQDLNFLLSYDKFKKIRKILKTETINLLNNEIARIKNGSSN